MSVGHGDAVAHFFASVPLLTSDLSDLTELFDRTWRLTLRSLLENYNQRIFQNAILRAKVV
jgi:hypothetical protein